MRAVLGLLCALTIVAVDASEWQATRLRAIAWQPPIGIPAPAFGINEAKPVTATKCPSWPAAASSGCYYIDNSHPSATDTANTQGYPNLPRLTIPNAHSAGDYVEIRGDGATGTYKYTANLRPTGVGTALNPIWFVGVNTPILSAYLDMGFSNTAEIAYMIFDGLQWSDGGGADIRPRFDNNAFHHLSIRNSTFKGRQATADGTAISVGSSTLSATRTVSDVVLYNIDVADYGDRSTPGEECGIYPVFYVTRLWVLDSDVHNMAEDGFAGSHGGERSSTYYYIGRNNIYNNLTNAIDIKGMEHVIISENTIWDHFDIWEGGVQKSSGQGEAIVSHYSGSSSGPSSWDNHPNEVSILFNTIYNSRFGLATSIHAKLRVVGNVIYNMTSEPTDFTNAVQCFYISGVVGDHWIVDNTCYNSDGGIRVADDVAAYNAGTTYYREYYASYNTDTYVCTAAACDVGIVGIAPDNASYWTAIHLNLHGNIFANRIVSGQGEIDFDGGTFAANSVRMDYNTVFGGAFAEVFFYGNTTARDLAYIIANTAHCDHCINTDPLFTNPGAANFTLQALSPAKDTSVDGSPSVYDDFFNTYGISIRYDRAKVVRPQGAAWDIGAYERVP